MKKEFKKKLSLHKRIVSKLNQDEMVSLKGGTLQTQYCGDPPGETCWYSCGCGGRTTMGLCPTEVCPPTDCGCSADCWTESPDWHCT